MSTTKLRESCGVCAASKVKCTREKPTCARCVARGLDCQYLESRRSGRPAKNAASRYVEHASHATTSSSSSLLASISGIWTKPGARDGTKCQSHAHSCHTSGTLYYGVSSTVKSTSLIASADYEVVTPEISVPTTEPALQEVSRGHERSESMQYVSLEAVETITTCVQSTEAVSKTTCLIKAIALFQQLATEPSVLFGEANGQANAASPQSDFATFSIESISISLHGMIRCSCACREELLMLISLIIARLIKQCKRVLLGAPDRMSATAVLENLYALQELVNQLSSRSGQEQQLHEMNATLASMVSDLRRQLRASSKEVVQMLLRL